MQKSLSHEFFEIKLQFQSQIRSLINFKAYSTIVQFGCNAHTRRKGIGIDQSILLKRINSEIIDTVVSDN